MTEITKDDYYTFSHGACHQLAKVLHDITGWPLYAFWNPDYMPGYEDKMFGDWDIHCFVRTPHGTYLDIEGEKTSRQVKAGWTYWAEGMPIRRVPEYEYVQEWNDEFDSFQRAREIAPLVLAKYYKRPGNVKKYFD